MRIPPIKTQEEEEEEEEEETPVHLNNSFILRSRVTLQKLTVSVTTKQFPTLYGTTAYTFKSFYYRSILISSFEQRVLTRHVSGPSLSDFPT
jgi:hypothetical protein